MVLNKTERDLKEKEFLNSFFTLDDGDVYELLYQNISRPK